MATARKSNATTTSVSLTFEYDRETKNTYRFAELTDGDPVIGKLYINKSAFGAAGDADRITLTIELAG